jgi:hypothetical protein
VPLFDLIDPLAKMGQALFAPPNVKGWRTGTDWLNSATLLARNNFAEKVALGTWNKNARPPQNNGTVFKSVSPVPVPSQPSDAPPPPDAKFDICELVYAAKPKDVAAVVKRLSEMLYGNAVPAPVAKKLETFLCTPGPAPAAKPVSPKGPKGQPGLAAEPDDLPDPGVPQPKGKDKPKDEPKKEPLKPLDPKDVKIDSPAFKARVREAAHAMMCLPEYQLD